jgi:hypothetical protein
MDDQVAVSNHVADIGKRFQFLYDEEAELIKDVIDDVGIEWLLKEVKEGLHPDHQGNLSKTSEELPADGVEEALSHVLDEESGKMIHVDDEMIQQLHAAEGWLVISEFIKWIQLAIIQDEKLYAARDCTSMKEYSNLYLPDSYGHVKKMISVGRAFKGVFTGKGASMHLLEDGKMKVDVPDKVSDQMQSINEIGITKLYELTKIPEADFKDAISKGVVTLDDGREIDLSEIKEESAR